MFGQIEAAVPARVLKFTDRPRAFQALCDAAQLGVEVEQLVDCARRMAVDPEFRSRKFVPPLEDWIGKGQWRGWMAEEGSAMGGAAAPGGGGPAGGGVAFDGPPELRQALVAAKGEEFARQTLDLCRFEAGPPGRVIPRTGWIEQQLRKAHGVFAAHEIVLTGRVA